MEAPMNDTVKLKNDFHGTEVTLRVDLDGTILSAGQVARARRALCGFRGCTCAHTYLGTRGRQEVSIMDVGSQGEHEIWIGRRDEEWSRE
jgi:hypothetical protein